MRQFIIDELNKVKDNAHNFNLQDQEIDGTPEPCIRFIDAYNVALKVAFNVRDNQANPVENLVSQAVPQAMPEPNQRLFTDEQVKKLLDDYCGLIIANVRDHLFEDRPTSNTTDTIPVRAKQNLAYLKARNLIERTPKPIVKS